MVNNNNEYIACFYGTYNDLYISLFEPNNNYNLTFTKKIEGEGGIFFKALASLDEKQKAMVCVFKGGFKLKCFGYDIITDELTLIVNESFSINNCGQQPYSFLMEYFYETKII